MKTPIPTTAIANHRWIAILAVTAFVATIPVSAQERPNAASLIAAQREAMKPLAFLDGVWRGSAWMLGRSGEKRPVTQTERIGPFLDGSVKVIEGRSYDADGSVTFQAFGVISYDPATKSYTIRSYAMGRSGDFAFTPTAQGYTWDIPAGSATMRYTATVREGTWYETGDRIAPDQEPVRFFEMNLTRVGATDWPAAGAIGPQ